MADKLGSSSYANGDAGGSHGDYEATSHYFGSAKGMSRAEFHNKALSKAPGFVRTLEHKNKILNMNSAAARKKKRLRGGTSEALHRVKQHPSYMKGF